MEPVCALLGDDEVLGVLPFFVGRRSVNVQSGLSPLIQLASVSLLFLFVNTLSADGRVSDVKIGMKTGGGDAKSGFYLETNHLWNLNRILALGPSAGVGFFKGQGSKIADNVDVNMTMTALQIKLRGTTQTTPVKFYLESGLGYFLFSSTFRQRRFTLDRYISGEAIKSTMGLDLGLGFDFKMGNSFHMGLALNRQFVSPDATIKYSDGTQKISKVKIGGFVVGLNLAWIF